LARLEHPQLRQRLEHTRGGAAIPHQTHKRRMRCFVVSLLALGSSAFEHHHHHHHHGHKEKTSTKDESQIMARMKKLEVHLAQKTQAAASLGHLLVNGPLPADFSERFAAGVAKATGAESSSVKLTATSDVEDTPGVVEIAFQSSPKVVKMVENEAADPNSELAKGGLHSFLVAKEETGAAPAPAPARKAARSEKPSPVEEKGIDIDTQMPYGDLEPFGREDTAQELTESSVTESNEMVDQLERAEVAEEKRSVFRALTRLRGAAITSFDGVARSQTGNIDEYNKVNKWRKTHPLHHLADEESDITKWAFPDNADLLQEAVVDDDLEEA